jgi:precorrin-6B methylase 2
MLLFHDSHPENKNMGEIITHVQNFFLKHKHDDATPIFEDVMKQYAPTHNNSTYYRLYSYLLNNMRKKNIEAILEIGALSGSLAQSLSEVFPESVIVGIHTTLDHIKHGIDNPMVTYIKGDVTSPEIAKSLSVYFDLIIDDVSREQKDKLAALNAFAPFLRTGGTFIIKDILGCRNLVELRNELEETARKHDLSTPIDWYDMQHITGRVNDVVAVLRRSSHA